MKLTNEFSYPGTLKILALMMSATVLSACGSGESQNTQSAATDQSTTNQSNESAESNGDDSGSDPSDTSDEGDQVSNNPDETNTLPGWILSSEAESAAVMLDDSGQPAQVNVQAVSAIEQSGQGYTVVMASGMPDYQVVIDEAVLTSLSSRPRANSDFATGSPDVAIGDVVEFGQDIGYNSNTSCALDAGQGYWPPGPVCPEVMDKTGTFPNQPAQTSETCETGLGSVGFWVNGTSVYNWGDGQSYNNEGVWQTLAPVAEQYDVDVCGGHAAQGDYHHHYYSSCLADMVGDTGMGHSPIYGYAADGYAIYGPWEAQGQLAISSWEVRDYSASEATGCSDGARSCVLNDQYDVSQGTRTVSSGPGFSAVVRTLSNNELVAENGYYKEDFYWNTALTAQGGNYLDQYNGHSDSERGYHYHVTAREENGKLIPAFPYTVGDRFAGELQSNALTSCGGRLPGGPGRG
ncbi:MULTISPECIES: YHYH protein [unclassified Pseudoalteromonas]|uniref:YHYH protein n=1 Tax=unclassified Pseudoalteromonas TaxID=194690 RepID=UPI002098376D|nr:YHYH protein [Pseudoalteromonas sp. XMcav2-N]MCO7190426.1 YHYH protein [Pseudoalteromonas sp. XMcav2-N]